VAAETYNLRTLKSEKREKKNRTRETSSPKG